MYVAPAITSDVLNAASSRGNIVFMLRFLEELENELQNSMELNAPNPFLRMTTHLLVSHFEGKIVTQTSMISASQVPYATATRKLNLMMEQGLIEQRPRTRSGKTFSLHPSPALLEQWQQLSGRLGRICEKNFGAVDRADDNSEYYFGGSYMMAQALKPLQVLPEPLRLSGGLRVLVHGDPTFMVMDNLKRQFEQNLGTQISQRAFSIDRLREESLRNATRKSSRYDIIAVDLPWIGEFAEKQALMPLNEIMDVARLDPADFHSNGWRATFWDGKPYAVPAQTTPELLFYRRDIFSQAGLQPPSTTEQLLEAAKILNEPEKGRFGIAWNAARGTALGHSFLMAMADFAQPCVNMREIAGGYDSDLLAREPYHFTINNEGGRKAAEYLLELLKYSPPDILSMSWYERIRPYAAGKIAMAFGYTLLAPYFESDPNSPAFGQTGYLPHPSETGNNHVAPVGGYAMGIPANLAPERVPAAVEALVMFTSPAAQKLYIMNGSRTNPRYSVSSDPEVRQTSPIFEAIDEMSWRDELQFWPRPPVPEISQVIQICGEEMHDMLRGIQSVDQALQQAQKRCDALLENKVH